MKQEETTGARQRWSTEGVWVGGYYTWNSLSKQCSSAHQQPFCLFIAPHHCNSSWIVLKLDGGEISPSTREQEKNTTSSDCLPELHFPTRSGGGRGYNDEKTVECPGPVGKPARQLQHSRTQTHKVSTLLHYSQPFPCINNGCVCGVFLRSVRTSQNRACVSNYSRCEKPRVFPGARCRTGPR